MREELITSQGEYWNLPVAMRGHVDAVAACIDVEAFSASVNEAFRKATKAGGPTYDTMEWTPRVLRARHTAMQAIRILMDRLEIEPYEFYIEAPTEILDRYDAILAAHAPEVECRPDPGTEFPHLRWMLSEMRKPMGPFKASRWLGFIQGVMIMNGLVTVPGERDFTRPYLQWRGKDITA